MESLPPFLQDSFIPYFMPVYPGAPQLSTGPKTAEGKKRSSLNALRHGLSGQIVVLPNEDMQAYLAFGQRLLDDMAPKGELEKQMVQTLVDTQWRLNRGRAVENSIFAMGHEGPAGDVDVAHPEVHATMAAARLFMQEADKVERLSRYEQRLTRTFSTTLKQFREIQAERKAREDNELYQAGLIRNLLIMEKKPFHPADYGFVLTTAQVDTYNHRHETIERAEGARRVGFNLKKFRANSGQEDSDGDQNE
jgi:hypothetical protein